MNIKKHSIKPKLFWKYFNFKKKNYQKLSNLPIDFINAPGVFETMRADGLFIFAFDSHLKRFQDSLRTMNISFPLKIKKCKEWVLENLEDCRYEHSVIRISYFENQKKEGILNLIIKKFNFYPDSFYKKGVSIKTSSIISNHHKSFAHQVKSNQYLTGVASWLESDANHYDCISINSEGYLSEGTVSNLFLIKNNQVLTPSSSCGILMGVTRELVLKSAQNLGCETFEKLLTRHDLYTADEVFLTNTTIEALPIVVCDGRQIGNGKPGYLTKKIRQKYHLLLKDS